MKRRTTKKAFILSLALAVAVMFIPAAVSGQQNVRLSDDLIERLVKHRLMRAGVWQGNNIEVDADDGMVELEGKVRSQGEKLRAERIALRVDDVMGVENKLEVDSRSRNDQEIAYEVAKDIRGHAYFDIFDWVEGRVVNGVVTLTGAVREPWRKKDYGEIAADVLGVEVVNNQIEVLPNSVYDDQIRVAVARLIYRDPQFARYANRSNPPIHIIVKNGRVALEGAVSSQVEKQLIGSRVRSSILSFEVVNNLKVDTDS